MKFVFYRIAQFFRHLRRAPLNPTDLALVDSVLPTLALQALFRRMTPGEQAHSLQVWRWLQTQGHHQPELQQAALLHDVGKSIAPLNIVERVLIVLGFRFFHRHASQWSRGPTAIGWRKPFVVAARHPAWGADLAADAGAAPTVVHLIRRHQSPCPPDDHLLHHLQLADENA